MTTLTRQTIALVDDHPILRQGVKMTLAMEPDLHVCGEATNIQDALKVIESQTPDLVIVDICLDSENGLDLVKYLAQHAPQIRILVYSVRDEGIYAQRALQYGATGYLSKNSVCSELISAVRSVLHGKVYVSPNMSRKLLEKMVGPRKAASSTDAPLENLTSRELEVFEYLGSGLTSAQIAARLGVSSKTVDTYKDHLKRKLNLKSGLELLRYAMAVSPRH